MDQLRGSLHNSLPPPKAGWVVEGVERGPALLLPLGQGYEVGQAQSKEMALSVLLKVDLQNSVDPEEFLEEWSEYTVQHWV